MQKSETIKEIAAALVKFSEQMTKIKKGEVNPFFKSKYASLSDILDNIKKPLIDNGLSFVQFPKGENELETILMHTSGEWLSESYYMKPAKIDPQGYGSVITYQRRYALGAILGLNIDEDDDANKVSDFTKSSDDRPWLTEQQFNSAIQRIDSKDTGALSVDEFIAKIKSEYKMKREYSKQFEDKQVS